MFAIPDECVEINVFVLFSGYLVPIKSLASWVPEPPIRVCVEVHSIHKSARREAWEIN
jgi:hypothetical protein